LLLGIDAWQQLTSTTTCHKFMAPFLRILGIDDPYGNQNNHNNPYILRHLCLFAFWLIFRL
jgi:hypothetical protein